MHTPCFCPPSCLPSLTVHSFLTFFALPRSLAHLLGGSSRPAFPVDYISLLSFFFFPSSTITSTSGSSPSRTSSPTAVGIRMTNQVADSGLRSTMCADWRSNGRPSYGRLCCPSELAPVQCHLSPDGINPATGLLGSRSTPEWAGHARRSRFDSINI